MKTKLSTLTRKNSLLSDYANCSQDILTYNSKLRVDVKLNRWASDARKDQAKLHLHEERVKYLISYPDKELGVTFEFQQ